MADYSEIIGNSGIVRVLKGAAESGQVSHAYLFHGPEGSGKRLLAEAFAQSLQCEEGGGSPCHHCRSCRQAESGKNPDIIHVTHEKPGVITVEEVRTQVVGDVGVRPYACRYKVYVVDEAEKLNTQAQNALLKTIEEPPEYAVLLLLTGNKDAMLPTVLSRCRTLDLLPVPDEEIRAHLTGHFSVDPEKAALAAAFSDGAVGKAVTLATSEDFGQIRSAVIALMKEISSLDAAGLGERVQEIVGYKLQVRDILDLIAVWYRDVLLYKATREIDRLIFRDETHEIRRQASRISYQGIEEVLRALEKAKDRLAANVSFELTMELLLLTIQEKKKK